MSVLLALTHYQITILQYWNMFNNALLTKKHCFLLFQKKRRNRRNSEKAITHGRDCISVHIFLKPLFLCPSCSCRQSAPLVRAQDRGPDGRRIWLVSDRLAVVYLSDRNHHRPVANLNPLIRTGWSLIQRCQVGAPPVLFLEPFWRAIHLEDPWGQRLPNGFACEPGWLPFVRVSPGKLSPSGQKTTTMAAVRYCDVAAARLDLSNPHQSSVLTRQVCGQ